MTKHVCKSSTIQLSAVLSAIGGFLMFAPEMISQVLLAFSDPTVQGAVAHMPPNVQAAVSKILRELGAVNMIIGLVLGFVRYFKTQERLRVGKPMITALVAILALSAFPAAADTGGVIPIGADGTTSSPQWVTPYAIFHNVAGVAVTQKVGRITFTAPGFDDFVVEPTITLQPGETRRLKNMHERFDRGRNYILHIEAGVEATVLLTYRPSCDFAGEHCKAQFEVDNLTRALYQAGESFEFNRIATDYTPPVGTWMLVLNLNAVPETVIFRVFGPQPSDPFADERYVAPAGISVYGLQSVLPDGGHVRSCLVACGSGTPGSGAGVYPMALVGPPDGGTQGPRYPEAGN